MEQAMKKGVLTCKMTIDKATETGGDLQVSCDGAVDYDAIFHSLVCFAQKYT